MSDQDYAIVIGLSQYSRFTPPATLQGPVHDVDSIRNWLVGSGNVPASNIWPGQIQESTRGALEEAFLWIDKIAAANVQKFGTRKVGRRLYFYLSGHGFSPQPRHGCFLAGDAAENRPTANIGATHWLDWWQDAGYFREYVLWMDCCMNRLPAGTAMPAPLSAVTALDPPSATFIAFGAERPLRAVEYPMDEDQGKYHGVFTWNLLRGLEGAAADAYGRVTGRSLADWLRNAVLPSLSDADRRDPEVSKQPAIIAEDANLIFTRRVTRPKLDITLRFPAELVGRQARLWSGMPPTSSPLPIAAADTTCKLVPGLYVVEVPEAGYRQGFEVTASSTVVVDAKGPAVSPVVNGNLFKLTVEPNDPTSKVKIVAGDFSILESEAGALATDLTYGLYKIQVRVGRQIVEQVILLDADFSPPIVQPDGPPQSGALNLPAIASAAVLPQTFTTHEAQVAAVEEANTQRIADRTLGKGGGQLMLMARVWRQDASLPIATQPWADVTLHDSKDQRIANLADEGSLTTENGYRTLTMDLPPGVYFLRRRLLGDQVVEQSVIVPPGNWRVEAYVMNRQPSARTDLHNIRSVFSVLMRRRSDPWRREEDTLLEKARVALADGQMILNDALNNLLLRKFSNPMAGIIGGHLLLIQAESDARQLELLNEVVSTLQSLVGYDHPDVQALSLKCPDRSLRTQHPLRGPPMFEPSWRLALAECLSNPKFIPLALWRRLELLQPAPPFLAWTTNKKVLQDHHKELWSMALPDRTVPSASAARHRLRKADAARLCSTLNLPPIAVRALYKDWLHEDGTG